MNNIKQIRKSKDISVTQLAQMLNMSQGNLSKIENGQVELRLETAQEIAFVLGCPLNKIFAQAEEKDTINMPFTLPLGSKTVRLRDDTMSPTFKSGDIAVYQEQNYKDEDGIYVLEEEDGLKVRRLQTTSGDSYIIIKDNPYYRDIETEDSRIVGKVSHKIHLETV